MADGRCAYTHDTTDDAVFPDLGDEWRCPHPTHGGADECVFHRPPGEVGIDDDAVARRLCWTVNGEAREGDGATDDDRARYAESDLSPAERKQFIGASFGDLRPPTLELATVEEFRAEYEETPVDLRECTIVGSLDVESMHIRHDVRLDGARISDASFERATVEGSVAFETANVEGTVEFGAASVEGNVWFQSAVVDGDVGLQEATVGRDAVFRDATVRGNAIFQNATVDRSVWFASASVEGTTLFQDAVVGRDVRFEHADVDGRAAFEAATVVGDVQFGSATVDLRVEFDAATVEGDATFDGTTVGESLVFGDATVEGTVELDGTSVGRRATFTEATVARIEAAPRLAHRSLRVVDLTGSRLEAGCLKQPPDDEVFYDIREATLGDVGARADCPNPYRHVRFDRTEFDGFDFVGEEEALSADDWRLYRLPESGYEALAAAAVFDEAQATARRVLHVLRGAPETTGAVSAGETPVGALPERVPGFPGDVPLGHPGVESAVESVARELTAAADPGESPPPDVVKELSTQPLTAALVEANRDVARWRPSPTVKAATQRLAKNAARDAGLEVYAAEFFIHEMRARREGHAQDVLRPGQDEGALDRLRAAIDWLSNAALDLTTTYGERTRRVVVSSLVVVAGFAAVYKLLDAPAPTGRGWADYVLFSFQSFIAFILGGAERTGDFWIQFASAVEGFTGAFFVALFVFALTRSVQR